MIKRGNTTYTYFFADGFVVYAVNIVRGRNTPSGAPTYTAHVANIGDDAMVNGFTYTHTYTFKGHCDPEREEAKFIFEYHLKTTKKEEEE